LSDISRRRVVEWLVGVSLAHGVDPSMLLSQTPNQAGSLTRTVAAASAVKPDDPFALVDPELLPALKASLSHRFALTNKTLTTIRKEVAKPPLPPPAPQPVDRYVPGAPGSPEVHLVIVDPSPGAKGRPVLVHMHGGGYVFGSTAQSTDYLQKIARDCGCVVVSVDYRLAPETHYPGSLEDNYAALRWIHKHADELGVGRSRIAVGGESAGGGHAAALAIAARDRGEFPIVFQMLIYPMLDDRTGSSRQVSAYIGSYIWTAEFNRFGWQSLLGTPPGLATAPTGAVPARVKNLSGLPPAYIGVGSIDLFVDEDMEYARRLIDSGVSTELFVAPGAYHAFDLIAPNAGVSKRFTGNWKGALRRALATS
jgi:acetyl esterase/lipase